MAVTTIEHERVHIDFDHVKATGAATSGGLMHAQVMEPVSMVGASRVSLTIDWIAWKGALPGNLKLEVILQQSNDGANWHTVPYTTGTTAPNVNIIPTAPPVLSRSRRSGRTSGWLSPASSWSSTRPRRSSHPTAPASSSP